MSAGLLVKYNFMELLIGTLFLMMRGAYAESFAKEGADISLGLLELLEVFGQSAPLANEDSMAIVKSSGPALRSRYNFGNDLWYGAVLALASDVF